ncbi:MAG: BspA family leucine-rich repeat surface protein [Clostridia bacterium]|nr:BspA family leucine-rich repeat surface protein [Clostridia bacterium]
MRKWLGMMMAALLLVVTVFPAAGGMTALAATGSGTLQVDAPMVAADYTVLDSDIPRSEIVSVTFAGTLSGAPANAWDVSESKDGSVLAWTVPNGDKYDLFIAAEGAVRASQYSAGLFQGYTALEKINFNGCFDTSGVRSMDNMFAQCGALTELDLTGFDISRVDFMDDMFYECSALEIICVREDFCPPEGTNLDRMFYGCRASLVYADESEHKDGAGENRVLRSEVLSDEERGYDLTDETQCGKVLGSSYDRTSVTEVYFLNTLEGMPADAWDVSEAGDGSVMAWVTLDDEWRGDAEEGLLALYIAAEGGVIANENSEDLFRNYVFVEKIHFNGAFDTSGANDMSCMFYNCCFLTEVDVSGFNTANVFDMQAMFGNCISLPELDVTGFNTQYVLDMSYMFLRCCALTELDVSSFDTSLALDMRYMFNDCDLLTALDLTSFTTEFVVDMSNMFSECEELQEVLVSEAFVIDEDDDTTDMFKDSPVQKLTYHMGGSELALVNENILRSDIMTKEQRADNTGLVLGSDIPRAQIATVSFLSTLKNMPSDAWDVSEAGNGSVMAWVTPNGELYDLYIAGNGGVAAGADTCCELFGGYTSVTSIRFDGAFDTSRAENMQLMFYNCVQLTELNLRSLDTANVQDMSFMFYSCIGLTELDVSGFNTSNVTTMESMFDKCSSVTELDVTGFDTSKVEDMSFMFYGCSLLTELDVTGFNTSAVLDMKGMFYECSLLTELDVAGFDTSKVKDMSFMFYECIGLTELDVAGFNTSSVTSMESMFDKCSSVKGIDVSGFDTSNVTDMSYMFYMCSAVEQLDVSGFDTADVTDMKAMFYRCSAIEELDVSGFNTANVTDMNSMFYDCAALKGLDLASFDTGKVLDMSWMFASSESLTSLNLISFNTVNVGNMSRMFYFCEQLASIEVGGSFVIGEGVSTEKMFEGCAAQELTYVSTGSNIMRGDMLTEQERADNTGFVLGSDIPRAQIATVSFVGSLSGMNSSAWDVSEEGDRSVMAWVTPNGDMYDLYIGANGVIIAPESCCELFANYTGVTSIRFGGVVDTSGTNDMQMMFADCNNLKELDLSGVNTQNVQLMSFMFYNCYLLEAVDTSSFDTSNVVNMKAMFHGCSALDELDVSGFNTSKVQNMVSMFYECSSLTGLDVSGFDTSNVTDMNWMFGNCVNVKTLDVSGFSTSNVTNMHAMFGECSSLTGLDVSGFDTSNVTDMNWMFGSCVNVKTLDVSGFRTSNVTNMNSMFYDCSELTGLDVSGFDTSNVTDMGWMFGSCEKLTGLDLTSFSTANVTEMNYMFYYGEKMESILVSDGFVIGESTNTEKMFEGCAAQELTYTDGSSQGGAEVNKSGSRILRGDNVANEEITNGTATVLGSDVLRTSIGRILFFDYIPNGISGAWDVSESGDGSVIAWIQGNGRLNDLCIAAEGGVIAGRDCSSLFRGYQNLTGIGFNNSFDTSATEVMYCMFADCTKLEQLDLSSIRTDSAVDMGWMFYNCYKLESLDLSGFETSGLTAVKAMFCNCYMLKDLNLDGFDTSSATDMTYMFYNCFSMEELDLSGFRTGSVTAYDSMFDECTNLKTIIMPGGAAMAAKSYSEGSYGNEVRAIQQKLADGGYLAGSVDGSFGKITATAVKFFQLDAGLQVSGVADLATQLALFGR